MQSCCETLGGAQERRGDLALVEEGDEGIKFSSFSNLPSPPSFVPSCLLPSISELMLTFPRH